MKVPGLYKEEFLAQPSTSNHETLNVQSPQTTKKVWKLKKYSRTDDEIQQEQKKYEDMEFTPRKASSRRPKIKPGNQEFVFVDLSPKKKEAEASERSSPLSNVVKSKKSSSRVSRLFRLSSSQETLKSSDRPSGLLSSPVIRSKDSTSSLSTLPSQQPQQAQQPQTSPVISQQIPNLKRSYTTLAAVSRYDQQNQRERSNSSASLVMTISDSGRAVLQPQAPLQAQPLSASSSTSDLFSLTRHNSTRQTYYSRSPIPSPKRMESPVPQDRFPANQPPVMSLESIPKYNLDPDYTSSSSDEESADAFKAFSKIVKKSSRKRANTVNSINSVNSSISVVPSSTTATPAAVVPTPNPTSQKQLTRNHSISSISSIYTKTARISPSRANLLRQATTPIISSLPSDLTPSSSQHSATQSSFIFGDGSSSHSYFEEASKSGYRPKPHHTKQISISMLGAPLHPRSEAESVESPSFDDTSEIVPFDESNLKSLDVTLAQDIDDVDNAGNALAFDTEDFFDFNAFGTYDNHNNLWH